MTAPHATPAQEISFTGKRIRYASALTYDAVLARLRAVVGVMGLDELGDASGSRAAYEARIRRHVGSSGFVLVADIDHAPWIAQFGIHRRVRRWIFGNPLVAIGLIEHDVAAGLFVPPDLLLVENDDHATCHVLYVQPSSLIVVEDNPPLRAAALALDDQVAALVRRATSVG